MMARLVMILLMLGIGLPSSVLAGGYANEQYAQWSRGPSSDSSYFPIGVWLQSPSRAAKYKAAGFNIYVGLWQGPTEDQLTALRKTGMPVICDQNEIGLKYIDDPIIMAWMHNDEPDNAQSDGKGGYGPPILPDSIVAKYNRFKAADPSRPVFLNLGQGVSYDNYIGRGVRRNHLEDYVEYMKGTDIVSYDIYPANSTYPEVKGNLWFVSQGVQRLINWSEGKKIVWNYIECTNIHGDGAPTPEQVRFEVWSSIIHGSTGILYFVHRIDPFLEYALLEDPAMLAEVTDINTRIATLAPVLNSLTLIGSVEGKAVDIADSLSFMVKRYDDHLYIFAAAMRNDALRGRFTIHEDIAGPVEVINENRAIDCSEDVFEDDFGGYGVHIYKIPLAGNRVEKYNAPEAIRLFGNHPNPFNPSTAIEFSLLRQTDVIIAVYDALGAKVATLHDGVLSAGRHSMVWNGLDASGRPAASGIYRYRILAEGAIENGSMTLIR